MSFQGSKEDPQRVALRTLWAGLLIFAAGLAFVRCHVYLLDPIMVDRQRLREALVELDNVAAATGPTAMFFGSSLVWHGFLPSVFDARLAERGVATASFNFGFGGLNPDIQRVLTARIRSAYEAQGRRLRLAVVEFNPFQTTLARGRRDAVQREQDLMMLTTPAEIARLALSSPQHAASRISGRYFRSSISPEATTSAFGEIVRAIGETAGPTDLGIPGPGPEQQALLDARDKAALDFGAGLFRVQRGIPAQWELEHRGELMVDFPETHEALEQMLLPVDWDTMKDVADRIRCCDILELRFDEALIADFLALVNDFAAFADHVEVVLMPVNHRWIERTPDGRHRLAAVIERIRRETGVPVTSFESTPGISDSHFWDSTHLSFTKGGRAFSTIAADHYAPLLLRTDSAVAATQSQSSDPHR